MITSHDQFRVAVSCMNVCVAVAESVRSGSVAVAILLHPSLFTVFRVVPTLVSHENDSQKTRVSSLAGMEVEPSTWYSSTCNRPQVFGMNRQWLAILQESIFLIVWDIHGVYMATQIHTTLILAHRSLHICCA